ncbi:MAG: DUF4368 domain-containing protein [Ruminococcus sp.]|nr:DUF4368 domain-containing protein [Ruminococcus sp.]
MINEFVEKVIVHRAEKVDGRRVQTVEVYLNFIGMIDFPEPEPDYEQEKIDEYWRDRYRRSKERELARRKKVLAEENIILDAKHQAEWERKLQEYKDEIDTVGPENMSVIPALLETAGA